MLTYYNNFTIIFTVYYVIHVYILYLFIFTYLLTSFKYYKTESVIIMENKRKSNQNIILIPNKFINQIELKDFTSFELKFLFNSFKHNRQSFKKSEQKKINNFISKLNDYSFIQIQKQENNHIKIVIDDAYKDITKGNKGKFLRRYTRLDLGVFQKLKKKKSLLLYIQLNKLLKKSDNKPSATELISKAQLSEAVDYQRLSALDTLIEEINNADLKHAISYQYDKGHGMFQFTLSNKVSEKRSLAIADDTELSDVSDLKLEQMFLEIATEITKRNNGNVVNPVELLHQLKSEDEPEPSSYAEAISAIETTDDTDTLLEQHTKLTDLVSRIDRRLENKDSQAYALARQRETYNDWEAKKAFAESQKTLDVDYVSDVLGYSDNKSALQLLEDINMMLCNSIDDMGNKLSFGTIRAIMDIDDKHTLEDFQKLEDLKLIQIVSNNETNVTFLVDGGIKHRKVSPIVNVLEKVHQQAKDSTVTIISGQLCF